MDSVNDETLLVKYKLARMSDSLIASRLGITVEEVDRRWNTFLARAQKMNSNGSMDFANTINTMAYQYQLLGASLSIVAKEIGNQATAEDIEKVLSEGLTKSSLEDMVSSLLANFIILRPFTPVDPSEVLRQDLKKN